MSIEENRNCNCNCSCQMNSVEEREEQECMKCKETERRVDCELRREMMQQIRAYEFSINELALYLDTHPEDQKALCLYRKYCKEVKELKDKYQRVYGPLTINYPCNKWRWLEEPWPSFILGVTTYLQFFCEINKKVREKM